MMRTVLSSRWLAVLFLAALLSGMTAPTLAAPPAQATLSITARGFIDVAGGTDPDCPGCNLEFDPEDEAAAQSMPLPPMTFRVFDSGGGLLAEQTTSDLADGVQAAFFDVPDDVEYTLELVADPVGWTLCEQETRTRTLTMDDFQLGGIAVENFHFWKGCPARPTATSPAPTPTTGPGTPTTVPPTRVPDDEEPEDEGEGDEADHPPLGYIKGLAFLDQDADGILDPTDPGLNDVGIHLGGGGLELFQVTGPSGQFSFDGLGPGKYDVFVAPGPEWRVTTQSKYAGVTVDGDVVKGIDFGLARVDAGAPLAPPPHAGKPMPPAQLVAPPPPGAGIRLPSTGIADLPAGGLLGGVALLLGVLAVAGLVSERRRTTL
jgi:hypothetical protein